MLERAECKVLLVLLSILSLLALASTISALIISIVWKYVGFLMSSASFSFLCSTYLTIKLHYNIIYNYNAIFICACCSILFSLFVVIHMVYLAVIYYKSDQRYFEEFTQSILQRLYVGLSMSLLGGCIGVGYYLSYIIQQGWSCLNFTYTNWVVLGALFIAALVFLLIAWIYLLSFWILKKDKFQQPKEQTIKESTAEQQPTHMLQLFEALKEGMKKQPIQQETNKQIKQPLLDDEIEEQDRMSQMETEKEKLAIIPFEEYKKMERHKEQKERKKQFQQQVLMNLLLQEQQKKAREQHQRAEEKMRAERIMKEHLRNDALSPDDPNFERAFLDSDHQDEMELQKSQQKSKPYYPANFVPQNKKESQQFQKYKRDLLKQYKNKYDRPSSFSSPRNKSTSPRRHPQNIEGGRSKKVLDRYMKKNKRPLRDESIYIRSNFDPNQDKSFNNHVKMTMQQNEGELSQKSASANWNEPQISIDPPPSKTNRKEKPKQKVSRLVGNFQQPQVLCFHKNKTKSPNRKKLFQQQQKFLTNQNFSSVLGSLVKGVEQATFKNKLKDLRQKRHQSQGLNVSKRKEKLLESIRSKFS